MSRTLLVLCLLASVALATARPPKVLLKEDAQLARQRVPRSEVHRTPVLAPQAKAGAPVNMSIFANSCQDPQPLQVIPTVSGDCYWIPDYNFSIKWTLEDPNSQQYFLMMYNSTNCVQSTWQVGWGSYGTSCFTEGGYTVGVSQELDQPYAYSLYSNMVCGQTGTEETFAIVLGSCFDGGWEESPDLELYNTLEVDPVTGLYQYTFWNDSKCTLLNYVDQGLVGECFQQWKIFPTGAPLELPAGHTHVHQAQVAHSPTWRQVRSHDNKKHHHHSSKKQRIGRRRHQSAHASEIVVAPPAATPVVNMTFYAGNDCTGTPGVTYSVPSGECFFLPQITQSVIYNLTDPSTGAYAVTFFAYADCGKYQNMTYWTNSGDGCYEEADIAVSITQL